MITLVLNNQILKMIYVYQIQHLKVSSPVLIQMCLQKYMFTVFLNLQKVKTSKKKLK